MRTKRGGYKTKAKPGKPRIRAKGQVTGGGEMVARFRSPSLRVNWRALGQNVPLEPLDAGLKRFLALAGRGGGRK